MSDTTNNHLNVQQQIKEVIDSKSEFVLVLTLSSAGPTTVHFEPQLRDMWLADASHKLKLPGKNMPVLQSTCTIPVSKAQVQEICNCLHSSVTEVINIDAQNDAEDEDYTPSSDYDSSDDDDSSLDESE